MPIGNEDGVCIRIWKVMFCAIKVNIIIAKSMHFRKRDFIHYVNYIQIMISKESSLKFADKSNMFLIFISYILVPFAFFVIVIYPLTNAKTAIVAGIYMLPLIYMVFLSTFLPFPEKSKLYISLSMFLVLLASGVSDSADVGRVEIPSRANARLAILAMSGQSGICGGGDILDVVLCATCSG